jgi:hypothetical protein
VYGKCSRDEEINYMMWGAMTRLCGKSLRWSKFKIRAYLLYYYTLYPPYNSSISFSSHCGDTDIK